MAQRPTTLNLFLNNCPAAVGYYEAGTEIASDLFAVGTVAHEVLHAIGEGRSVDAVTSRLMSHGVGGPDPKGAIRPDHVLAGRDLAMRWVDRHPMIEGDQYERRYSYDRNWQACDWDQAAIRTRIDVTGQRIEGSEEYEYTTAIVRDYKSSWRAPTLEHGIPLQQKIQAVCVWRSLGQEIDVLRIEIAALRTFKVHSVEIPLDGEGIETLEGWSREIMQTVDALEAAPRVASPGGGCVGCLYAANCEHGQTAEDLISQYLHHKSKAAALEGPVKESLQDREPIDVGSAVVGFSSSRKKVAMDHALPRMIEIFAGRSGAEIPSSVAALIASMVEGTATPATWIERIAKRIHPSRKEKADRDRLISDNGLIIVEEVARFGVKKKRA